MKVFKVSGILLLLMLVSTQFKSQNILTILEKDNDGNYQKKNDSINYTDKKIVDINSILNITVNKDILIKRIAENYEAELPDELSNKFTQLLNAMKNRNESIAKIEKLVDTYDYDLFKVNATAKKAYTDELARESQMFVDLLNIDGVGVYYEVYGLTPETMYSGAYVSAEMVLNDVRSEIEQFVKNKGVYIQFGGWLIGGNTNAEFHIPGFDDIAPKNRYEVERWQFIPTDQQLNELEELQKLAQDNKDKGLELLKKLANSKLEMIKEFANTKIYELTNKLIIEANKIRNHAASDTSLLQSIDNLLALEDEIKGFMLELNEKSKYYKNIISLKELNLKEFIDKSIGDVAFFDSEINRLLASAKQELNTIAALPSTILATAGTIKNDLTELVNNLKEDSEMLKVSLTSNLSNLLYGQKLDVAAIEFSDNVYKLGLQEIPENTDLDLTYVGVRKDGDRIALKLSVGSADKKQTIVLESREIYMFRVLKHVQSTVGIIFGDPIAQTSIESQFQMMPYYNVLFKGFWDQKKRRKSIVYNRLFQWGWGFHMSYPDFNKDDVPELGLGIALSFFNDYLQTGAAINVFTPKADPYWFFGVRIPISISSGNSGAISN